MMAASFKDVIESYKVALDVGIRICDTVSNSGLSCKIDNHGEVILFKKFIDSGFIGNVCFDESPVFAEVFDFLQTPVFDIDIVVISDGIYSDDLDGFKFFEQPLYEIAANKTGSPSHENCLAIK